MCLKLPNFLFNNVKIEKDKKEPTQHRKENRRGTERKSGERKTKPERERERDNKPDKTKRFLFSASPLTQMPSWGQGKRRAYSTQDPQHWRLPRSRDVARTREREREHAGEKGGRERTLTRSTLNLRNADEALRTPADGAVFAYVAEGILGARVVQDARVHAVLVDARL